MQVTRMPLPGPATVVVFGAQRQVVLDVRLTRDQAALAIQGLLPDLHPDIVDHWLDKQFERRALPFTSRHITAMVGAALALMGAFTPHPTHQPGHGIRPRPRAAIVLTLPGTRTA